MGCAADARAQAVAGPFRHGVGFFGAGMQH